MEMDLHGMKRKDLQALCKNHGIPGNLKNSEMATRLASVFEKDTGTDKKTSPEESVKAYGIKDNVVVSRDAKKVKFSPEAEVFEFTRSVKKRRRNNVGKRSQGSAQDLQQDGIELRRSTRTVANKVKDCSESESKTGKANKVQRRSKRIGSSGSAQEETELMALDQFEDKDIPKGLSAKELQKEITTQDGYKLEKVGRRSTRLTAALAKSCLGGGETSYAGPLLLAKRSKRLVDKEVVQDDPKVEEVPRRSKRLVNDSNVQNNAQEKDLQDDPNVEKAPRRSKRLVNDSDVQNNAQDQRRSRRLKTTAANPSMGGGEPDGRPLCPAKESKEEKSKRSVAVNGLGGGPVKNKTNEASIDCEVQTTENYSRMKVQDVSKVEKVTRGSKRLGNNVDVPLVDGNMKALKHGDLEVEKAPQSMHLGKNVKELQVDDKQPKKSSGNDGESKIYLRRSKRTALDNIPDQAIRKSSGKCLVNDNERDGASADNLKKSNANDKMQVRGRFTRNSSRHVSSKAPIVVEGNLLEKKRDEILGSLVKSSKRVSRRKKRDRSVEPVMGTETATTQSNLTPEKLLDKDAEFEEEEVGGTDVVARSSSKRSKTKNQECVKDKPQETVEDIPSFSETTATETVTLAENVLDTLEKPVDSSQRTDIQKLNSELIEGEREEKLERDTVLVAAIEEEEDDVASPASVRSAEAELVVPAGHLYVEDIDSTAIAVENTKTKGQTLVCTPGSELKDNSSIAKLANVEATLGNSAASWKESHSSKNDEKGSIETKVQAADLHGNVSECNTENSSAEEEMEIGKVGFMGVGDFVDLTPGKLLDEYPQPESEETVADVEARASFKKMKTVDQAFVKDKPQGLAAEDSPSTSENKNTGPLAISENVLDSTPNVSGDISLVRNTQELNSELMEEESEEKHERDTVLIDAITDKEEASSLSVVLIKHSEVSSPKAELFEKTTPPSASTVIAKEDNKTKEEVLSSIPKSELKEHSFVAKLSEAGGVLGNSAECWKEIHSSKDDEKSCLEREILASNLHGNFSEYNTENSSAVEEMEIGKVGCTVVVDFVNLTPEKLLDEYPQSAPEETVADVEARASFKKMKTVDKESVKDKPQGLAEDSPFTSENKNAGPLAVSENDWDSTPNVSGDISLVRNTQERNSGLLEEEREEKHEQDTVLIDVIKDKEEASSLSVVLIEHSEVSSPEAELFEKTTPPPASTVIAKEDKKTKEEVRSSIPKSELKEHSFVAKLAEAEGILGNSTECWKEIHSSKDDEKSFLEREILALNLHGNFSEYNTENSSAEEQAEISKVGRINVDHCVNLKMLDEVKDDNLEKSGRTISSERGYKLNALVATGSTGSASLPPKGKNVSDYIEEGETEALSQPTPITKASSSDDLEESAVFTTRERNLMLMEQLSRNGKTRAVDSVTHHNDKASPAVFFKTPEQVLLLGDYGLDEAGKEEENTATDVPDEADVNSTTKRCLMLGVSRQNEEESMVVELHGGSDIATSPVDSVTHHNDAATDVPDEADQNEATNEGESMVVELHGESDIATSPVDSVTHHNDTATDVPDEADQNEATNEGVSMVVELHGRSDIDTSPVDSVTHHNDKTVESRAVGDYGLDEAGKEEEHTTSDVPDEADVNSTTKRCLILGASRQNEATNEGESMFVELHGRSDIATSPVDSVTHLSDKAVESRAVGDYGLDEAGKEAEHTTSDVPDEADVHSTTKRCLMLGASRQNEATNEGESMIVELHGGSDNVTSPLNQISVGDFNGDGIVRNEENRTVEFHCESGLCTIPDKHASLGNSVSDGAESSGGSKTMEFYKESVVHTGLEGHHELFGCFGQDKAREGEEQKAVQLCEESELSTALQQDQPLADSELGEAEWQDIDGVDKTGLLTNLERQPLCGDSDQEKQAENGEKAAAEFHEESTVPNIPERHLFPEESEVDKAAKSEANKALELRVECSMFTSAEKHLLLETEEGMKGDNLTAKPHVVFDVSTAAESQSLMGDSEVNEAAKSEANEAVELRVESSMFTSAEKHLLLETEEGMKVDNLTAKSHVVFDVSTAAESQSLMGDSEPDEAEKEYGENKGVEGESNIFTNLEKHLLSEDPELEGTRKERDNTVTTCEESYIFPSPERQLLGNSEPQNSGKQEQKEVEYEDEFAFFSMLESRLLLGESGNTIKSDLSQYQSHHSSSPKLNSKENSVVGRSHVAALDSTENIIVGSNGPTASKVSCIHQFNAEKEAAGTELMPKGFQCENLVGLDDTQGTPKQSRGHSPYVDSERNVSPSPHVIASPAKGNSETDGEIPSHLEVAGTCSMVSETSGPSTEIQKQINNELEEIAITDYNGEDEVIEAKATKNSKKDCERNLLLDSSGGSYASGKKCVLAETEDEHLPIATAFDSILTEKAISSTPDESAVQNNMNEKETTAADEEMVSRESTPSSEEALNQSSENREDFPNVAESGMLYERQVRQEPNLIYRTQVKPKRHDMKENAPNSKIVHNLNVTAPRTSKRQPLQDLRKN